MTSPLIWLTFEYNYALNLIADRLMPYFDGIPKQPSKLKEVVSWNVTSLCSFDIVGNAKDATIGSVARQCPVLLQETEWNSPSFHRFRQATPNINTIASLAINTDNGQSGGVAVCLPQDIVLLKQRKSSLALRLLSLSDFELLAIG